MAGLVQDYLLQEDPNKQGYIVNQDTGLPMFLPDLMLNEKASAQQPVQQSQPTQQPQVEAPAPVVDKTADSIYNSLKNWDAAMKARRGIYPQQAELAQAEQDLRDAIEEDKNSGSDGYEAKEDGVFNRIKNWGASVSDFLFGKDVDPNSDEGREAELQRELAEEEKQRAIDKHGVLGYYTGGALGSLLGKQGLQEWQDFKNDFGQRGIGAFTQRANSLLNDMANSPYSNFVDPTTVLGGQRTMVNDIDSYFNNRGIQAVKNDMLAQKKLDTELAKTKMGQFQDYMNRPPEEQAKYRQFAGYDKKTGTQGGYKSLASAVLDLPNVAAEYYGRENTTPEEQEAVWNMMYPNIPLKDAYDKLLRTGAGVGGIPTNPKALAIREGLQNYQANPEAYPGGWGQAVAESWNKLPASMKQTTYQPQSVEEARVKKQLETAGSNYAKNVYDQLKDVEDVEYDATIRDYEDLLDYINDPANEQFLGGPFNATIKGWASSLGYNGEEQDKFLASFLRTQRGMHAKAIRQINQSGATNKEEQRYARQSILDLSKSAAYNKDMLERAISNMALARAMKRDEAYLVEQGSTKQDSDAKIRRKYGNMIHNPKVYIDPELVDRYSGEDVVYMLDSNGNWAAGMEE